MKTSRPIARLTITGAALLFVVAVGCTDEQRRTLGELDVQESLASRVETVVSDRGMAVEGSLDCSSDIAADGTVTGSCTGITTSGAATTGTFAGTGDVEAGSCSAHLVVDVDGQVELDELAADCFAVG